jgi:phenylacetaldehyde dehydrogenase
MRVVREEIFGPVLTALPWNDLDDLITKANDSPYGLSAGVWTNDIKQAHRAAAAIKAGTVWINCYNLVDPATPFGGFKQSGWGREHGRQAMELYSEINDIIGRHRRSSRSAQPRRWCDLAPAQSRSRFGVRRLRALPFARSA